MTAAPIPESPSGPRQDHDKGERRALRQFQRQPCDLVVCDIFMPNKDGIATLRELRRLDAALPVITMTGGSPSARTETAPLPTT